MEVYEVLENEFGDWLGQDDCIACSSGTAAIHLALEAMEFPLGSEIICPDFTMVACARAITLAGHIPVFVDCLDDLNINPGQVQEHLTERTAAILVVHIYGRLCDLEAIWKLAAEHNLKVIEDCAECPLPIEASSSVAHTYSFYKNKHIAGEEGGMCWFKDPTVAYRARELRSLGFNDKHNFLHRPRGHNYRLSNCHAQLILDNLMRYSENAARRNQIEDWYNDYIPLEWQMPFRDAVWVYDLRIPDLGYQRMDLIVKELNGKGIAARHSFKPMTMQQEYRMSSIQNPQAFKASQEVLYLPVYPSMEEREIQANAEALIATVEASDL